MRNLIALIACLFLQLTSIAQTNIRVILKTDLKIDSVDAFDVSSKEFHAFHYKDTLDIKFKKQNIDLYNIRYFVKGQMYRQQIWLDTGYIIIKAHTNDTKLIIDTVINSPIYYNVIDYLKHFRKLNNASDTLANNSYMLSEIQKNLENPRSIAIANDFVNFNQNSKSDLLRLKLLMSKQKSDFSWFVFYNLGIDRMNKILSLKVIDFSDFKFIDRQNKVVAFNHDKYDYYLFDFWFVGCTPCMQQHKNIKKDYLKLKRKNIGVIGISIDSNFDLWHTYLSKHSYQWDNYLQSGKNKLSDYLGIHEFPAYVLVNKKGEIIGNFDSWDKVMNSMDKNN